MRANWVRMTVIGTAAVVGLGAGNAQAQEAPVRLTLDQAIASGLEASHRLAALDAHVEAADAKVTGAVAADRPRVDFVTGVARLNHVEEYGFVRSDGSKEIVFPDVPSTYRLRFDFSWPIYTWGRTDALERAARAEAAASGDELEAARADLRLEITRAFWGLVTAREAAAVLEEALRVSDQHLTDVRNRQSVGLVPPSDALRAEAQRAHQEVQLIEARNFADAASADLARLVGLAPGTPIETEAALTAAEPPAERETALVEEARAARADRDALSRRVDAAVAARVAAGAGTRPQLLMSGGFDYNRPNSRHMPLRDEWRTSWDLGVTLSWPLWDAGRTGAQVAEAAAYEHVVREQLAEFDTTLEVDVPQGRRDLAASLSSIAAAETGVRAAREALRVVRQRYREGVATNTEVLDAQVALVLAELDRTRAVANSRLAEARLNRTLGR
jgi:outer membrane protein TolC